MIKRHFTSKLVFSALSVCAAVTLAPISASAQTFPDRPVRVIIPYQAGAGADVVMRVVAEKLSKKWGQSVLIDNRPGGNTWIGIDGVKKAAPDGYTLLFVDAAPFVVQPHAFKRLPFEVKDFEPVAPVYWAHYFYVVSENSKWKSMTDLIDAAKAKPGEVTYGSWGTAGQAHLAGAMIDLAAKVRMTHVPFKDSSGIYTGVANGDVSWALGSAGTAGGLERAKKVRFLAIASPKRHPSYPNVPTVAEAGGTPAMEINTWISLFAPRGTPKAVIERINADVAKVMVEPDVRERLLGMGFEPWAGSAADVAKVIDEDSKRFGAIIKSLNIQLD